MFCENCGGEIKYGSLFCGNCGAPVSGGETLTQSEETIQPPAQIHSQTQAPARNNMLRNTVIVCSFVLFICVAFVAGLYLTKQQAHEEITLDLQTIDDEQLLNTLKTEYDKDDDGKLSNEEIEAVESIELTAGEYYSYIYLFYNLKNITAKGAGIKTLDLSKNTCLKQINCHDATNVREINLPNLPDYSGVDLPDNTDIQVTFPEDSEYEMKFVPKRVEETKYYGFSLKPIVKTKVYEQDVISPTKIASLKCYEDSKLSQDITYNYSNAGTITSWGYNTTNITYDENNRVSSETGRVSSPMTTTRHATYAEDGNLATVSTEGVENKFSRTQDGQTMTLRLDSINSNTITNYWKFDGSNLNEYLGHKGTNGSSYLRRNYEWVDKVTKKEKLEVLDGAGLLDAPESFNSMSVTTSDTATFVHNGYKLLEANYDSGFSQKFEYTQTPI